MPERWSVRSEHPTSLFLRPQGWKAGAPLGRAGCGGRAEVLGASSSALTGQACPQCLLAPVWSPGSVPVQRHSSCQHLSQMEPGRARIGLLGPGPGRGDRGGIRSDSSGVVFQTARHQCLVGFRLPGAFKDKNTLHHKLTRSLGMSDPMGRTLTSHPHPLLPSPQARSPALCPGGLPFKDGVLGTSRGELSDLQGACASVHALSGLHSCPPSHNLNVLGPDALR